MGLANRKPPNHKPPRAMLTQAEIESAATELDAVDWHAFDRARSASVLEGAIGAAISAEQQLADLDRDCVRAIERLFRVVTRAQSALLEVEIEELARAPLDEGRAIWTGVLRRQATMLVTELQRVLWIAHQRLFARVRR